MKSLAVILAMTAIASTGCVRAEARSAAPPDAALATIDSTRSFDLTSAFTHESYRIQVFIPSGTPPPRGFPVLYVLDGNVLFGTFAGAMRNESQAKEITPAVIVGIASGPGKDSADRTYDFTAWDLSPHEKNIVVDLGSNPRFGGYESFFRTIQEEIKPRVDSIVHVDDKQSSLFGWSLGGLFVIHTLLVHPTAFCGYAALSPALWRGDKQVFTEIPRFKQTVIRQDLSPRLFVGVGSLEEQRTPGMLSWKMDQTKLAQEIKYGRMVENAQDFANALQPFFQERKLGFLFRLFVGDTHNTAPWSAINPVLSFLYAPEYITH